MGHFPKQNFFRLCWHGDLPWKFLKLEKKTPICIACVFAVIQKMRWRMGSQINHIRDENDNEPGDCSSIDQIVYLQSRLMPRISIVYTQD